MADSIVVATDLNKKFKDIQAVNNLSFTVDRGEVYGFLGQNGAGKSTTIRMLLTLIEPTAGRIEMFGLNLKQYRKKILQQVGAIIEKPDLYKYLTALQNLQLFAKLSGLTCTKATLMKGLEQVGIDERASSKVKTFSQGMRQRLGIACALIHNPQLIILDEPTNGLDPQGIADIRNLILHLSKNESKTVVVSSHLLNEIELIADAMLIIDRGKKIAEGKVGELLNPANTLVQVQTTNNSYALEQLQTSQWQPYLQKEDGKIGLRLHQQQIPELTNYLVSRQVGVLAIESKHSLEDFFLSLTTANQHVAAYQN